MSEDALQESSHKIEFSPVLQRTPKRLSAKISNNVDGGNPLVSPLATNTAVEADPVADPREDAKRRMKEMKGGKPVEPDDTWVNVYEKIKHTNWRYVASAGLHNDVYVLPDGE